MASKRFLSFAWKTHQKRDVANVSQTHPIMSFAENWHRTCRADKALGQSCFNANC
jgi:hypothetical protein